jgi:hypothetical protein
VEAEALQNCAKVLKELRLLWHRAVHLQLAVANEEFRQLLYEALSTRADGVEAE